MEEYIQTLAFPPAVHIAFAQTQRTFLQNPFKKERIFNPQVGRRGAIDFNSRTA
ncbi:hypothetical protein M3O75_12070 [Klebsiella pneumoniae]|nr:hypothetical protein [Klebsiella pneumoniae]